MRAHGAVPDVSILVATYNTAGSLEDCLDSIFGQAKCKFKVQAADSCSVDGTQEILLRTQEILLRRASKIKKLVIEKDHEVYDAWNKLLPHVAGKWIIFLGGDDKFVSDDALATSLELLSLNGETSPHFAFGTVFLV